MKRTLIALALGLATIGASPALAGTTHRTSRARTYKVARPPLPNPMPRIIRGPCPGLDEAAGCFIPAGDADYTGTPWPTGAVFTDGYRFTTAHELGHAFDATMMDAGERQRFIHLTRMFPGDVAWNSTYVDEEGRLLDTGNSPAEVFADAYASCRIGQIIAEGHEWTTSTGYMPTAHIERMVCRMIVRAGQDIGTPVDADGYR
jgi:hypothetical protein